MGVQSEDNRSNKAEQTYSDEYYYEIAVLAGNIPRMAKGAKGYKILMARDDISPKVQISFTLNGQLKSDEKKLSDAAISQFIKFANESELWGVDVGDDAILTFENAGSLSNLIAMYIDTNPDNLSAKSLDEIEGQFSSIIEAYGPDVIEEHDSSELAKQGASYPVCANALIEGMMTIKTCFESGENLSQYYMENPDNGMVCMMIACENMEAEDFADPDDMDVIAEMYDELSVLADGLPVVLKMQEDNAGFVIEADDHMSLFRFIKKCYIEKNIAGREDAYHAYNVDGVMANRYGDKLDEIFGSNDQRNKHVKGSARRHFAEECVEVGLELVDLNGEDIFGIAPMSVYSDPKYVLMGMAIASESRGVSLESVEARVFQDLGIKTENKHRAFRIH